MKYAHSVDSPCDNLIELKAAHEEALKELDSLIPIACARDGHKWDHTQGKLDVRYTNSEWKANGPWWDEGDPVRILTDPVDVFVRICVRCGKKEVRDAIIDPQSPFEKNE